MLNQPSNSLQRRDAPEKFLRLPWVPRRVDYTRERISSLSQTEPISIIETGPSNGASSSGPNVSRIDKPESLVVEPSSASKELDIKPVDVLTQQNILLRDVVKKLSSRIGDEIISEDSDSTLDSNSEASFENPINTRHYQIDSLFADKYYFITNVSNFGCN